jgi:major membrane immunogen (membrane-anchored lipoprotein)
MKNLEEEKSREDNAKKIGKITYSKVILKGTINVDNYQNKEVTVTVTKSLSGTVLITSNDGKTTKVNSYNYINPSSNIKWEVKLNANEKKVLTYEYEVFFVP